MHDVIARGSLVSTIHGSEQINYEWERIQAATQKSTSFAKVAAMCLIPPTLGSKYALPFIVLIDFFQPFIPVSLINRLID